MILRPAERAGLEIDEDVVHEILEDAGTDPGALPLVAFCLEELYRSSATTHRLTAAAYDDLGRLHGAIGRRAEELLSNVRKTEGVTTLDIALSTLFHALVHVDVYGTVTRRRTFRDELAKDPLDPLLPRLMETLVQGRLLQAEAAGGQATIMVAHEALFDVWPELKQWIERNREDLMLVDFVEAASFRWYRSSQQDKYLIPPMLLADITALQRHRPDLFSAVARRCVKSSKRAAKKEKIVEREEIVSYKDFGKDEVNYWLRRYFW